MYGHSYGGLLMRQYTKDHPEKVQRVLTAGTPFFGAPKSLFFLSFGVENPLSGVADLDTFLPNAEAKAWAGTATGLYHLIPSDNFGPWLRVGPAEQDQAGVRNWYTTVAGINGALVDQARGWHQAYDGFSTENGFVENRAVISTGLMTIGGVDIAAQPDDEGNLSAIIRMVDGDITVPVTSASQGALGTHAPLGDPVHVQATCRIAHMDLGGDPKVTEPYTEYLLQGRTPRKTEGACKADGRTIRITKQDLSPGLQAAESGGAMSLRAASDAGLLQLVEIPGSPVAVIDDHRPVDVSLGRNVSFEITRYVDGQPAGKQTYTDVGGRRCGSPPTRRARRRSPPTASRSRPTARRRPPPTRATARAGARAAARPGARPARRARPGARARARSGSGARLRLPRSRRPRRPRRAASRAGVQAAPALRQALHDQEGPREGQEAQGQALQEGPRHGEAQGVAVTGRGER